MNFLNFGDLRLPCKRVLNRITMIDWNDCLFRFGTFAAKWWCAEICGIALVVTGRFAVHTAVGLPSHCDIGDGHCLFAHDTLRHDR